MVSIFVVLSMSICIDAAFDIDVDMHSHIQMVADIELIVVQD